MENNYNPKEIEKKWQKYWEENKLFKTPENVTADNKFYILPQLPYPSGSGLHVGHAEVYTACDMFARYQRMKEKKVLQVIGWDSFGLPAENYAIKTNVHPRISTDKAIENFRSQIKALGISVDWDREVGAHNSDYYRWTQWFFLLMYKRGLAYRKKQAVNWCNSCQTVLANEQVVDGKCERCDTEVIQKEMEQWYLKITDYADKLLESLDDLDWPEETKKRQKDWIGRSEGAEVDFKITGTEEKITVFTTRPDTLFGATFMVLAPESQILQDLSSRIENWDEVEKYIEKTKLKTELDRQIEKEKTGVELKGIKAINPVNNEEIPIFTADYVLAGYGTGAIMAVPAHDERDFEFAKKFAIEIRQVVAPIFVGEGKNKPKENKEFIKRDSVSVIIKHPKEEKYIILDWKNDLDWKSFVVGGIENGEKIEEAAIREMKEETGFVDIKNLYQINAINYNKFYAAHKDLNRESIHYPVVIELASLEKVETKNEDTKNHEFIWIEKEKLKNIFNLENHKFVAKMFLKEEAFVEIENGVCINSDFLNDLDIGFAQEKIIEFLEEKGLGKRKIQYKLRDWSVSRQRFWGAPIPILVNEELKTKKYNYLFIHGFTSTGLGNFRKWLRQELETRGHSVTVLDLPNTKKPNVIEQRDFVLNNFDCDENTIIVAHSLGGPVTYRLLEKIDKKVAKVVLVDPVVVPDFVDHVSSAVGASDNFKFDFENIKTKCDDFVILGEKNPSVIFRKDLEYLRNILDARIVITQANAEHFCAFEEPRILEECLLLGIKAIPEKDLPVILPDDVDFKPTGQSPLNYSKTFNEKIAEKYGQGWKREPDTLDTFMCSSWYYYRYLDPHNENEFASSEVLKKWMPVDFYLGGPEHVNGHLLYSRFFTKVLFDAGYIDFIEPFKVNRHQGLILGPDSRKMSKRWGNVINPTDVIAEFGADTLRIYEMFMGPLEADKPWDTNGVKGVKRFLDKVWNLQEKIIKKYNDEEAEKITHKTLKKVGDDLDKMQYNTAIAKMMELVNFFQKQEKISEDNFKLFILMLAPFAPHIAEEMWEKIGKKKTLAFEKWPEYDENKIIEDSFKIAIQVNGKIRANIEVVKDLPEEEVKNLALADENVKKWLDAKEVKKIIYIKDKLVSIVV
jgi:leucyl-tRNA synthetase/predicted alpha/beta hydrolase family esterase